jgi:anionic cell wall polymer biosynthesis LytR-Cps2A-Psr (LCP) family protein
VGSDRGELSDKKPKPAKVRRRAGRIVLWTILGVVIAIMAAAGGFYLWYQSEVGSSNSRVDPDVIAALGEHASSTTESAGAFGPSTTSAASTTTVTAPPNPDSMNLVILGSDTRSTNGKGGRSDSIILVHIDTENDFLSMLSIPRDLRVKIPGHGYNKINAAYAYGGAALLIRTVQSAMGVDLDHYAETDYNGFKAITDALGGVYLDVDRTYDDGTLQLLP